MLKKISIFTKLDIDSDDFGKEVAEIIELKIKLEKMSQSENDRLVANVNDLF